MADDPFGLDKINAAIAGAKPGDEYRTMAGAAMALQPCVRHCTVCEGHDHHWLEECDSDGEPIMVCKHCEAWREYAAADMEDDCDETCAACGTVVNPLDDTIPCDHPECIIRHWSLAE